MKSAFNLPRVLFIAATLACLLAGCGQRGPLYLPAKPAPISTAPTPQTAPASDSGTAAKPQ